MLLICCLVTNTASVHLFAQETGAQAEVKAAGRTEAALDAGDGSLDSADMKGSGGMSEPGETGLTTYLTPVYADENENTEDKNKQEGADENASATDAPSGAGEPVENPNPGIRTASEESDSAIYYEELKIWFDPATGTVTDADKDIAELNLPDTIDGVKVTEIGKLAFHNCEKLTEITLPDTLTTIGAQAFEDCVFTSIVLPDSVTSIGTGAFSWNRKLREIRIPNGVTVIEDSVFAECSGLTGVIIPDSVTVIGRDAFCACGALEELAIPDSVTEIGEYAFYRCDKLVSVTLPKNLTVIARHYLSEVTTKYGTVSYHYDKSSLGGRRGTLTGIDYPDGTKITYTYDEMGRLSGATDVSGTVRYEYGLAEVSATDEDGHTVTEHYDLLGNTLWSMDAYGDVSYYEYDSFCYLTKESFGLLHRSRYEYNEDGRLTEAYAPDGASVKYTYDSHGGIASITDALGNQIRYDEDVNGMLDAIVYPDGSKESFTYDEKGNIATAKDGGGVTASYSYDGKNRLTGADFSTSNHISYSYDKKGNIISITEDGKTTAIEYDDDRGSLAKITYPNGKTVS